MKDGGFIAELRRRRVLPVAGAYVAIAWLVTEVAGFLLEQAGVPPWSLRLLAIIFLVGFPITVVLAWIIQVGPDGKRVLDSSKGQHRTVIGAVVLGIVATAGLAWLILPRIENANITPAYDPIPNSVAILPFTEKDATPYAATIGETLYEALTTGLDASREVTQVQLKLKQRPPDLVEFGRSMRVAALLNGRILRSAGATELEVELLNVASGEPYWTRLFDWESARTREIGTEISNDLLRSMGLSTITMHRFAGTDSQEAYEAQLLGQRLVGTTFNSDELRESIAQFQKAIDLDPAYVRAHVGLATAITNLFNVGTVESGEMESLETRRKQAMETAQELDPDSPDLISLRGRLLMFDDQDLAIRTFEHALELDPDHRTSLLRLAWMNQNFVGDSEKAAKLQRRLVELDPLNANNHQELAKSLRSMRRAEEAYSEMNKAIELEPDMAGNYTVLAGWEIGDKGRFDKAHSLFYKAFTLDPQGLINVGNLANNFADLGAREESLAWLEKLVSMNPTSAITLMYATWVHIKLDNLDEAMEYVRQFAELHPDDVRVMMILPLRDVHIGKPERAVQRIQDAYPVLNKLDDLVIDEDNFWMPIQYSWALIKAGQQQLADHYLRRLLVYFRDRCTEEKIKEHPVYPCHWKYFVHGYLQQKEETLAELRRMVFRNHYMLTDMGYLFFQSPLGELDFLKDDPEYQEIVRAVQDDLAAQLQNVRDMASKGEIKLLPPESDTPP